MTATEPASPTASDRLDGTEPNRAAATEARADLAHLLSNASIYLSTLADRWTLSLKQLLIGVVLAAVLGLIGAAVLITAAVLLVVGLAQALGALIGAQWAGNLIVATVIVVGVFLGARWFVSHMRQQWWTQLRAKYEQKIEGQQP
jgi:hypothetical protein